MVAKKKKSMIRVPVRIPKLIIDSLNVYKANIPVPPEDERDEQQMNDASGSLQDLLQQMLQGGAIILTDDTNPPQQPG